MLGINNALKQEILSILAGANDTTIAPFVQMATRRLPL
jgi:hypothetical protein